MPTSCQICSKLLQSSFLTFHYWWRGNSVYWRENSRRSHCCSNLCRSYNTACSHASQHHLSWWFFYKKQLLTQMTSQLLVNHSTGGIHYVSSVPNWLLSWRWKILSYYKRRSSLCGRYFLWNKYRNYSRQSTTSRSSYGIQWIKTYIHPWKN